ncbi:M48 family metalloprotease [Terrabacter terrigena]|uniref:M48 family metalloprotease n=1 Tax=Terrabacter terrigena TaxID=574718 RepID=A0ABW3N0R6_9MICO
MVTVLWLVPVLAGTLLVRRSRLVASLLPPAATVVIVTTASFLTAAATGFVLSVAAFAAAAAVPAVARAALWSPDVAAGAPPPWLGAVAGVVVVWLLVAALRRFVAAGRSMADAGLACRGLPAADRLVVVDDEHPDAYAVQGLPGLPGRAVVSTGMLRALTPGQRRVLLAHEDAHLAGHHQLFIQAAELAAAANPLLRPGVEVVREAVERWADETAATHVGDRRVVAQALAQAALARTTSRTRDKAAVAAVLQLDGAPIAARARAMLVPAPRPRRILAVALTLLALSPAMSALGIGLRAEAHFERAHDRCASVSATWCT